MVRHLKHRVARAVRRTFISRPNRNMSPSLSDDPVVVAGLFSTGSGIGQSARACYRALERAGVNCFALDLSPKFNQVDLISDIPTIDTLPPGREGTIILHLNGPETQHGLYHAGLLLGRKWRVIGYWAWELQEPPQGWARAAQFLSEIWAPSEFVRSSIARIVDIPVRVVPHYISVPSLAQSDTLSVPPSTSGLKFLTMADGFSSFHRKNVFGAIQAYKNAFSDECGHELTIKCRNLEKYSDIQSSLKQQISDRKDIKLMSKTLLENDVWELMQSSDVVISLHRAEGFGLHLAEAMALGKVVVGTNWSGNLSFMNPENSVLIPNELVEIEDPTGVYQAYEGGLWAQANTENASTTLKTLANNANLRTKLGEQARKDISSRLSPSSYLEALSSTLSLDVDPHMLPAAE